MVLVIFCGIRSVQGCQQPGKVREIRKNFKVSDKSGNLQNCQGKFIYQESHRKVRELISTSAVAGLFVHFKESPG